MSLSQKLLNLRHYRVHLLVGLQNAFKAPVELLGNSDLIVAFQSVDSRDRRTLSGAISLTREQEAYLALLPSRTCICHLPRSPWKYAFLGGSVELEVQRVDDRQVELVSAQFLSQFSWVPVDVSEEEPVLKRDGGKKFNAAFLAFLNDVVNKAHEFSALRERFERAGVRSASTQSRILKKAQGEGYVKIWTLAAGKGSPIKLAEALDKAFSELGIGEWKKGRGVLPTQAATEFLRLKLEGLGWTCIKEGELHGKQVDLLCRNVDGELVTIEVAHSPGHEVHNALHCLKFGEVKSHVVVATSREVVERVKKRLQRHGLSIDRRWVVCGLARVLSGSGFSV